MAWLVSRKMNLPPYPGACHLAKQEARRSRLLFGASALRPLLFQRVPMAPVKIALRLVPAVERHGRTRQSRQWGEGSFSCPSWRGWSVSLMGM